MREVVAGVNLIVSQRQDVAVGEVLREADARLMSHPRETLACFSTVREMKSPRAAIRFFSYDDFPVYEWHLRGSDLWKLRKEGRADAETAIICAIGNGMLANHALLARIRRAGWRLFRWLSPECFAMNVQLADLEQVRIIHACAEKANVAIPVALTIPLPTAQGTALTQTRCELMVTAAFGCRLDEIASSVRIVL